MRRVTLNVNGLGHTIDVPVERRLVDVLRDDLGLTGTKVGCEVGVCGVCTVIVDDKLASGCSMLAAQAHGSQITTIEGIAADPAFDDLRQAFIEHGGFQCGFCTSGQIVAAASLAMRSDRHELGEADIRQHLAGNLCRCTGYYGILRAVIATLQAAP